MPLTLNKGDRNRIFAMIEDVSDEEGPAKSEVTLADGTTLKVYKVGTLIRVDMQPMRQS